MQSIHSIAQKGYHVYCKSVGYKTFDGKDLPQWPHLGEDRQACWEAAVMRVVNLSGMAIDSHQLAGEVLTAYSEKANKVSHTGQQLPDWSEIPTDRQAAWQAAATHMLAEIIAT
jgi:hypothetical protein